jgi:hypothetical protein
MHSLRDLTNRFSAIFSGILMIIALLTTTKGFADEQPTAINQNTGVTYTDLQTAINDASSGNTIKVEGTFVGNFVINQSLILKGGKDAVLDGNQSGTTLAVGNTSDVNVEVINIKIRNGNAANGGGIANSATLTLTHVEVVDNNATANGGGIFNDVDSLLTIFHSVISGNSATANGGGVFTTSAGLGVERTEFRNNTAGIGAGLHIADAIEFCAVFDSVFTNNIAANEGGAVFVFLNSINGAFVQVKFSENEAVFGGAIYKGGSNTLNIYQSKLHENFAATSGGGLFNDAPGSSNLTFTKVTHNEASDGGGIATVAGAFLQLAVSKVEHNSPDNISYE